MKSHVYNDRLVEITIGNETCYFNFSIRAAKVIMKDYNGLSDIGDATKEMEECEAIDLMANLYALLLDEGAKYLRIVEGRDDVAGFSADDLQTVLNFKEMEGMQEAFNKAIEIGSGREIEVKDSPKNAKTA